VGLQHEGIKRRPGRRMPLIILNGKFQREVGGGSPPFPTHTHSNVIFRQFFPLMTTFTMVSSAVKYSMSPASEKIIIHFNLDFQFLLFCLVGKAKYLKTHHQRIMSCFTGRSLLKYAHFSFTGK